MKVGYARYLELVERRLELLRVLIRLEAEWRGAFIGLNLELSERSVAEEEVVCGQIRIIDKELRTLEQNKFKTPPSTGKGPQAGSTEPIARDPVLDPKILAAQERMLALQSELRRSNQTRRAILNRSKLTLNVLRNLFNSYAPTYAAPAALATGTIYEETI